MVVHDVASQLRGSCEESLQGSFCVEFVLYELVWLFSWHSSFLARSKNMHDRLVVDSKLTTGQSERMCGRVDEGWADLFL